MNKKILISILLICTSVSLLLTGCKKDKNDVKNEQSTEKNEQVAEAKKEDATTETEDENKQEEATTPDDSKSMEMYEAFLSGQEEVGISKVNLGYFLYEAIDSSFDKNKTYTMEELLDCFFSDRLACYENNYRVDELQYAFVDMGQDGERELVLHFTAYLNYDEYSTIFVIKNVSGKLEVCYYTEGGYRSYNYVNKQGVIATGGSGGASTWYDCNSTINSEGEEVIIYESESMSAYDLYTDEVDYGEIADKLGVADSLVIYRYSFEAYRDEDDSIEKYQEHIFNSYFTYGKYDEDEVVYPDEIYEPSSKYSKFMNLVSDNVKKPDEMKELVKKRLDEFSLTDEMLLEDEPDWKKWEGHEELFKSTDIASIIVENPSWTYYSTDFPYDANGNKFVKISEISHEANEVIDDEKWFNEIGIEMPTQGKIKDPSGKYTYKLSSQYGEYYHQYDTVTIINNDTGKVETVLDFNNFTIPDEYVVSDGSFVRECVNYFQIVDDVAYVSIAHRTYAESAPHNAYVMALDINDGYKVIWKSEPLICNAVNFAIVDGTLICGYGFTAEPDYIYLLNRYTGEKMDTIKVKTGPDYFYAIDNKLYVRTYDTNYVYSIIEN